MLSVWELLAVVLAAVMAGAVIAMVGGGTLITFLILISFGALAVSDIFTNIVWI